MKTFDPATGGERGRCPFIEADDENAAQCIHEAYHGSAHDNPRDMEAAIHWLVDARKHLLEEGMVIEDDVRYRGYSFDPCEVWHQEIARQIERYEDPALVDAAPCIFCGDGPRINLERDA